MITFLRIHTFILVMLLCIGVSNAQRHDQIWLFGFSTSSDSTYGGSVLEFTQDSIHPYFQDRDMNFDATNTSICDTSGNLLFYTNGIYIANTENDTIQNGGGINPGKYADDHAFYGYILGQGVLAIPKPGSDSLYYLFHASKDYPNNQISFHSPFFYYSLIDMSLNNGLGAVVEKNQIIIEDILVPGQISATKHANGRDWWILLRKYDSNKFYRILVQPDGIVNTGLQEIGTAFNAGIGQAVFSPNGSKYIVYNSYSVSEGNLLNIYDFDRCSGELSNEIQTVVIDSAYSLGAAVSPNSNFLYLSSYNYIYQYDLEAEDILASKDTVAIYDDFEIEITPSFSIPTRFKYMQLAPDGRIYINVPGAANVLHVINQPDEVGDSCEVLQHSVNLPTFNSHSLPNFPNYRLGAKEGSFCDSLSSTDNPKNYPNFTPIKLYPNPSSGIINIDIDEWLDASSNMVIKLLDVSGNLIVVNNLNISQKEINLDLSQLSDGIYFYLLELNNELIVQYGKLIIIK